MRMKLTREQKIAHRFLSSFDMVGDRLTSHLTALERAESARSSITGSIDGMGLSGSQGDRMCDSLVRMDESIDGIMEASGSYAAQFAAVEDHISSIQRMDPQAGKVLRQVYLDGMSAKEVASDGDIAKKTVYEHLKRGLDISFDLLSEEG